MKVAVARVSERWNQKSRGAAEFLDEIKHRGNSRTRHDHVVVEFDLACASHGRRHLAAHFPDRVSLGAVRRLAELNRAMFPEHLADDLGLARDSLAQSVDFDDQQRASIARQPGWLVILNGVDRGPV